MSRKNKLIVSFVSIAVIFLIISSTTSVPRVQGAIIQKALDKGQKANTSIDEFREILNNINTAIETQEFDIYLILNDLKNNSDLKKQINSIDALIKQKLGEDFLEDFIKTYPDDETVKEKIEEYIDILNPKQKSQMMTKILSTQIQSLTNYLIESNFESSDDSNTILAYMLSTLVFIVFCCLYFIGLPVAIVISFLAAIIYISLIAKNLFIYNTSILAIFFTISLFILACIVALAYAFTWPIWVAAIFFQRLISGNKSGLNSINSIIETINTN